jgi:hypothetical protein
VSDEPSLNQVFGPEAARRFRLAAFVYALTWTACAVFLYGFIVETVYFHQVQMGLLGCAVAGVMTGALTLLLLAGRGRPGLGPDTDTAGPVKEELSEGVTGPNPRVARALLVSVFGVGALLVMIYTVVYTAVGLIAYCLAAEQ